MDLDGLCTIAQYRARGDPLFFFVKSGSDGDEGGGDYDGNDGTDSGDGEEGRDTESARKFK